MFKQSTAISKSFIAILTWFISSALIAADNQVDKTISGIQSPQSGGEIRFTAENSNHNPANCGNTDFYVIEASDDIDAKLSILLSAYVANKQASFYVEPAVCSANNRPKVSALTVGESM